MKLKLRYGLKQSASALLVSLVLMTILAVSIAGYMKYVQQQSFLGARAQSWNMAMGCAEAGIEEALQHINSNSSNLGVDGWTKDGSNYSVTRTMSPGYGYTVSVDASSANSPIILSKGNVKSPTLAAASPAGFYAAVGVNTPAGPAQISRAVRVTTTRGSMFLAALVARHKIDMNGNNVKTDSFDSGSPFKSTNGQYDPGKVGSYDSSHGDVASNDGVSQAVSVGNANIFGHVYTGPGGSVGVGPNGGVGDFAWHATQNGFEPGWVMNNANFTFPTTDLPYSSGLAALPGNIITLVGMNNSNTVVIASPTPPGPLNPDQTLSPITTNATSSSTSVYPGNIGGLSTNTTWLTTATYPGSMPGLATNYLSFTTTTDYPGSKPALVTNILAGTTTVSAYPGPRPGGVATNCGTTLVSQKTAPAPGTYCGTAYQTGNGNNNSSSWSFYPISGYTYHNLSYTYASQISYTYPVYTYGYVSYTYSYTIYTGIPIYTTNHFDHVITSGDYYATSLTGTTYVSGSARLLMPTGLKMSGSDQITLATSASLKIYSGGNDFSIGGNGVVNKSGFAGNFIVYGAPSVTSFSLNGNAAFIGVLVAPNANVAMNGGGSSSTVDFTGSLMANSIKMNGHFNFHYDEALGRMGGSGRYLVTSWNEVAPN